MSDQTPRRRLPTWGQGLLILIAGIVIGLGGCFTALGNMGGRGWLALAGAVAFVGGLLAALVGILVLLYGIVKAVAPRNEKG